MVNRAILANDTDYNPDWRTRWTMPFGRSTEEIFESWGVKEIYRIPPDKDSFQPELRDRYMLKFPDGLWYFGAKDKNAGFAVSCDHKEGFLGAHGGVEAYARRKVFRKQQAVEEALVHYTNLQRDLEDLKTEFLDSFGVCADETGVKVG